MLVYDVDGDGLNDVVTAWHCHLYGLVWHKQVRGEAGQIAFQQHVILPPEPDLNSSDLRISQLHAFDLVDMNGDGLKDVLTGKRFWAHGPNGDKEPNAPAVVYWFELHARRRRQRAVHPAPDRRRFRRRHASRRRGLERRQDRPTSSSATRRGRSCSSASRANESDDDAFESGSQLIGGRTITRLPIRDRKPACPVSVVHI